jgi:16S rRNA (uracil1498-N3)-methyltransferase
VERQHDFLLTMKVRLFCESALTVGKPVTLPDAPAHHAREVLRLVAGDEVTLLNGLGGEYAARLTLVSRKLVEAEVLAYGERDAESPFDITVAQSLATGDKMDWIVEKAVELGATRVIPVAAERSVLRLHPERAIRRVAHWQAIARAACEQCGRNRLATIEPVVPLDAYLAAAKAVAGLKLMLSPVADVEFRELPAPGHGAAIHLLIGPEAGLSDTEEVRVRAAGFEGVTLGPRVMRTETAALAALAAVHARWGDF